MLKQRTKLQYANTIEDLDTLVMDYMKYVIKFQILDYDGTIRSVPIVYNGAERWVQVRRRNFIVDLTYNILYPIISFSRTSIKLRGLAMAMRMWSPSGRNYLIVDNKYSKDRPYSKFDSLFGNTAKKKASKYKLALPMAVLLGYLFQVFTDNHLQMNKIILYFMLNNKQWWIIGLKRIRMILTLFSNTTEILAQGQRLIKTNFSATGYGSLFPYDTYDDTPPVSELYDKLVKLQIKNLQL